MALPGLTPKSCWPEADRLLLVTTYGEADAHYAPEHYLFARTVLFSHPTIAAAICWLFFSSIIM